MKVFGVTGGIGSGKSLVCQYLSESGIPVIEADRLAKELTVSSPAIKKQLISEFGEDVYQPDGKPNIEKLSALVFDDPGTQQRINGIIHPVVLSKIRERIAKLVDEGHELIAVEAALIYESRMERMLDAVVVVDAPQETRISRVMERNKMSRAEVLQRMNAQVPVAEKREKADYIIENDGTKEELSQRVGQLMEWLSDVS